MTVKLGMTHTQLIASINSDINLIKDQGSKIITKEFPSSETETSSVQLDTKCQGKDYMFVFMDYGILEPSKYSLSADGLTVNFSPAIPANHKLLVRYFSYVNLATIPNGLFLGQIIQVPFGIDESKNIGRYLNGQVIIQEQFPAFTAEVKSWVPTRPSLFTTETNWQAEKTNSKLGQCGKFVVDDTAGTIRLPCVINAQSLVDLALIGSIKSESLPNITGHYYEANTAAGGFAATSGVSGAFYSKDIGTVIGKHSVPGGDTSRAIGFDASRSSSAYQNNAPVQQEAVQYPYCIVVNTGIEETDRPINEYQVNNVYSYGMSQYYKGTMNNNSWLKSAGQWNDGTVYTGMYNWLLEQMNNGVSGFVASTATYTDYDYVINTANQTFRLPLLNGEEDLPSDRYDNLTLGESGTLYTAPANGLYRFSINLPANSYFAIFDGNTNDVAELITNENAAIAQNYVATARVRKGQTIRIQYVTVLVEHSSRFYYATGNGSLYYYVGDTLQNAQLINVARIEEKLVNFVDKTSTTDRETVVGWGMPDYTAGVAKNRNTAYTAESDGLLFVCFNLYQTAANANYMTINNVVVHGKRLGGNNGGGCLAVYPLSKNDNWTFTTPSNLGEIMFYPFKGVK